MKVYDKDMYAFISAIADEKGIKWQYKNAITGSNEASVYQRAVSGASVLAISAPVRYIHSESNVIAKSDMQSVADVASALNERSFN